MSRAVIEIELNRFRNKIEVTFADGSVEEIENGIYESYDPRGRTIEERAATAADIARLEALVAGAGPNAMREVRLEDGTFVEFGPGKIEVTYPDRRQEEIENGIYERYDARGRTVEERAATAADFARLEALIPAEFRDGRQSEPPVTVGPPLDGPSRQPVVEVEIDARRNHIEVTYADGSQEEIEFGVYERYDARGRTVEERTATPADFARLEAIVAAAGPNVLREVRLEDGTFVEFGPGKIEVTYPDGTQEEIENGIYERYDARGRAVEERVATASDISRLEALVPFEFRNPPEDVPMTGDAGPDRMRGDVTDDRMFGEAGDDRLVGRGGDDTLQGGAGEDSILGGLGDDSLEGGADDDLLRGGQGRDALLGNEGGDRLLGGGGDDILLGGDGRDRMNGGRGDDTIDGGAGADVYRGGQGADLFVFAADGARDVLRDFRPGEDVIDLSAFGLAGFPEVLDGAFDRNGGVVLDLGGGDLIRLARVEREALSEGDFVF